MHTIRIAAAATALALLAAALTAEPARAAEPAKPKAAESGDAAVWPAPQQRTERADGFRLTPTVRVVAGTAADPAALALIRDTLTSAGVERVEQSTSDSSAAGETNVTIRLADAAPVLTAMRARTAEGLPAEGYALAVGRDGDRPYVAIDAVDAAGQYYAAQTLRQLVTAQDGPDSLPGTQIRDWPAMRVRGTVEGFYGTAWTHAERLAHLDYLAAHKMNTYVYAPKSDPYHRDRWRDPYPADQREQLGELAARARARHVGFTFALSPGLSICFSSDADVRALIAKFQSVYDAGGRAFSVAFDDIHGGPWHCDGDASRFGDGSAATGRAQAYLLGVVRDWARSKGDVGPLQFVPTEYHGLGDTPYRKSLREDLPGDVVVNWTGLDVISSQITVAQAKRARADVGRSVLIWDNYPVNDYIAGRLPMADYVGREPGLSGQVAGIVANPANQATVSRLSLFSIAAFAWKDEGYDADRAWTAALDETARGDAATADALRAFADVNTYDGHLHKTQAPRLRARIDAFWNDWDRDPGGAVDALRPEAKRLMAAPARIRANIGGGFTAEADAWLSATELWGKALVTILNLLGHQASGNGAAAVVDRRWLGGYIAGAAAIRDVRSPHTARAPRIADGVLDVFANKAKASLDDWLGIRDVPVAGASMRAYGDNTSARMIDGSEDSYYWSGRTPSAGDWFGVDLGGVHRVDRIDVLMGKPGSPDDYLHNGALESSKDGRTWTRLATGRTAEVHSTANTRARYLRYRATADGAYWCVVREFRVRDLDALAYTVTGDPKGDLAAAADGSLDTAYRANGRPAAPNALVFTASRPVSADRLTIVGTGSGTAFVRVNGTWHEAGSLRGSYTELSVKRADVEAVLIRWTPGSEPPSVAEIGLR